MKYRFYKRKLNNAFILQNTKLKGMLLVYAKQKNPTGQKKKKKYVLFFEARLKPK